MAFGYARAREKEEDDDSEKSVTEKSVTEKIPLGTAALDFITSEVEGILNNMDILVPPGPVLPDTITKSSILSKIQNIQQHEECT